MMIIMDKAVSSVGGLVASWLVHLSPDQAVRVRALARDIVLCSWARHFTLRCINRYRQMLGVTLRWTGIPSRGK